MISIKKDNPKSWNSSASFIPHQIRLSTSFNVIFVNPLGNYVDFSTHSEQLKYIDRYFIY